MTADESTTDRIDGIDTDDSTDIEYTSRQATPEELYELGDGLDRVHGLVTADRNDTHGDPLDNHRQIAELWSAFLRFKLDDDAENLVRVCPNCHERLERLYDGRFYDALGVEQPELDDEADSDGRDEVTSLEQRQRIETIKSIISEGESINRDGAPILTVLNRAEANGIERSQAEHEIEKLRQQGDVYEPNTDHLRVV